MDVINLIPMRRRTQGDVGIEIEMESKSRTRFLAYTEDGLPAAWQGVGDGSLRGNSIEYVFKKPLPLGKAHKELNVLEEHLKGRKIKISDSIRAGVHVHVNMQPYTVQQCVMFAAVYYALEEVLVEWCGQNRSGNLFCLRNVDAEGAIPFIANCIRKNRYEDLSSDQIRYASLNWTSLLKYGSLEFRALKTDPTFDKIHLWADLLIRLRDQAVNMGDIRDLLEQFSVMGPEEWSKEMLGDFYEQVKDIPDYEDKVWRGIRYAQDFLFFVE